MIRGFRDRDTERLWNRQRVARFGSFEGVGRRKLVMLNNARRLGDLQSPPGNALESLKGDRKDQHSIRINQRYRICFRWRDGDAYEVEITDYH
ncbi:MAG TPA: type II toxin-antitoxin system RelE/ParE family toxin [Candidatus Binatia bacterium]|nr:type II toxin-antitoxin system RelE/ParE family toxin [Candidatus Binatia bacterium]